MNRNKLKIIKRIITIFIIISLAQNFAIKMVIAQYSTFDTSSQALILKGINQVHSEEYKEALNTFEEMIKRYPQHPIGYFLSAAVYKAIMQNYRIRTFEPQLDSLLNLTIEYGKNVIRKNKEDAIVRLFLGGAYGLRGMHKVRKREWWDAFQDGRRGISNLKKAIKLDTTLYDAYHGLGTYHYWRGAKAGVLRFLPFFKNDKQRGIEETLLAINKGKYTSDEAKFGLVALYYDCKKYEKALSVNQELYELYATNASCLYMRSRILDQQEKWEQAVEAYQNLLNHLLNSEFRTIGYEVECHYHLASCHYKLGQFEDALKSVQKSLSLKNQRDTSIEMEGPLEDFNEIVKKAIKLQKKLTNKVVEREVPIIKSISFNLTKFKT